MDMCNECARLVDNCICYNGPTKDNSCGNIVCPCKELLELKDKLRIAENKLEEIRINGDY
jgi:hypothetical protein